MGYFAIGVGFKNCFEVTLYRLKFMFSAFCSISALSCSCEFVVVGGWWVGGGFQRFVSLNQTTVIVVLLLGCDNNPTPDMIVLLLELWLLLGCDNFIQWL